MSRVAVVTGAGRGIGQSIATMLSQQNMTVIAVARNQAEIEKTVDTIGKQGYLAYPYVADVSDWCVVQNMIEYTIDKFGSVDVLVNNAGVQGPIGPLQDNDVDDWVRTIEINLVGTFYCCKAVIPHMIQNKKGKIINSSGGGATSGRAFFSAYAASKTGIVRLTETLADELFENNIQVNAIAPGAVNTKMLEQIIESKDSISNEDYCNAISQLKSGGSPAGLAARLVGFLAREDIKLTGKLISAPHDDWESWDDARVAELMAESWFTLRRMDPFTLKPFVHKFNDE